MESILIHTDVLLDRRAFGAVLPDAWAQILAEKHGSALGDWRSATAQVAADWNSYWADLDLSGDDSLRQWREGRWRVVRAWFRLAGQPVPGNDCMGLYLDQMPREVGRRIDQGWRFRAQDALRALVEAGIRICIVDPFNPASFIHGMLDAVSVEPDCAVIGPDELGQVGSEGLAWAWPVKLAGGDPQRTRFVSHMAVDGWPVISPPDDLGLLLELIHGASFR